MNVIFDLDGVLTEHEHAGIPVVNYFASKFNKSREDVYNAFVPFVDDLVRGVTKESEILEELSKSFGEPISFFDISAAYEQTKLNLNMLHLMGEVATHTYTALLTENSTYRAKHAVISHSHLFGTLHDTFVTANYGHTKREHELYAQISKQLPSDQETLLIDNNSLNLQTAHDSGWKTHLFKTGEDTATTLRDYLKTMDVLS